MRKNKKNQKKVYMYCRQEEVKYNKKKLRPRLKTEIKAFFSSLIFSKKIEKRELETLRMALFYSNEINVYYRWLFSEVATEGTEDNAKTNSSGPVTGEDYFFFPAVTVRPVTWNFPLINKFLQFFTGR